MYEDELKKASVGAFNSIVNNKESIIAIYGVIIKKLTNNKELDLKQNKLQDEFEEAIWNATIELVKVNSHENITFIFKYGIEIDWEI